MVAITSAGVGSGLDVNSIVSQILAAEAQGPTNRLDFREAKLQVRLSAYGTMKSSIALFQGSLAILQDISAYLAKSSSVGDKDILAASVSSSAVAGSYDIEVTQLAKAHILSTDPANHAKAQLKEVTDELGTGVLTFKFGTIDGASFTPNSEKASKTVTITDASLQGIRDAVNDADIGVTASIIFDGSYQRLTFSSDDSGVANSMQIVVDDIDGNDTDATGLSLLVYDVVGLVTNMKQNVLAQDSEFTVNGISITSESTSINDVIDGVTLTLKDKGISSLDVTTDSAVASTAIKAFVANYNGLIGTINNLTSYNVDSGEAAQLNGDAIIRGLETQLKRYLGDPINSIAGAFRVLSDIGITSNAKTGLLEIDDSKLDAALKDDLDDVIGLFAAYGRPTDNYINFDSSTDKTQEGTYAISIDSFATKGALVASVTANLNIVSGVNDKISIKLDGVTAEITLTAGSDYTASTLVTELQSQINAVKEFRDSGSSVVVSESGGTLTITSNRYGSASKVEITGGNGSTDLVGSSTNTVGTDVAGSIGGIAATGSGQYLTGAGLALGLKIQVEGGSLGARGTVSFARGFADRFDNYANSLLDDDGVFESTIGSLKTRIESIDDDRKTLARRLATIEKRVRSQFIALDLLLTRLKDTGNFLTAQLEALPEIIVNKRR